MPNLTHQVEQVQKRIKMGFPDGVDETSRTQLQVLLARIQELERALIPFARLAIRPAHDTDELIYCYRTDAIAAWQMLDSNQGIVPPQEDFGIPAE